MIYLAYLFMSLVFIYNTPLYKILIDFVRTSPKILRFLSITGDFLYMVGGGVVAGIVYAHGSDGFTAIELFNNYGTIMVAMGAFIRDYFKGLKKD